MKTILFASHDPMLWESCHGVLEDEGYRVVLARDASQAVDIWKSAHPDAVILDNLMPQQQAMRVAEEIGIVDPKVPIILYVGYDDTYVWDARVRFVTACVDKSLDPAELKIAVRRAVSRASQGTPLRIGLPPVRSRDLDGW